MKPLPGLALALALALIVLAAPLAGAAPAAGALKSADVPNELGLHLNEYALSWQAPGQSAYRILVASDEGKLAAQVGDLWDSGRRESGEQSGVLCRARAFADGDTAWWKVMVWDEKGEAADWSPPAEIEVPAKEVAGKRVRRRGVAEGGNLEFVTGKSGQALRLGSSGPAVWAGDYEEMRPAGATTMMAWIQPEQVGDGWQCIYRKEDGNDRRLLALGQDGGQWGLWCGFGINGTYVEFGAPYDRAKLADGKWHHVAVSFDGTQLRLFVDGAKIGEQRRPGTLGRSGSARAYLGSYGGDAERFVGSLDELSIYASAISERQVADLVAGKLEGALPAPVAQWKFDGTIDNEVTFVPEVARNRIVLLGGTLISRMEKYGFFETAVTVRWPLHDIGFRNLGWPADNVFGTARSEFGSAQNTRSWQPPKGEQGFGFETLKKQLADARPSTVVVGYGAEAAYFDTDEKMERFEEGYRALVDELEQSGAKLVLLTPIAQARAGRVLPDPGERNARLERAAKFILALAKVRGHGSVDLLAAAALQESDYENGVHLNESGYRRIAAALTRGLKIPEGGASVSLGEEGLRTGGGQRAELEATKRGVRFDFTVDQLPSPSTVREPVIGAPLHVVVDGEDVSVDAHSGVVRSGYDHEQTEQLRQAIVEKNKIYRYRLNPINKAYIFLFRRHEMGHLAYEMEDFEEIVEGREQVIAKLRVPRTHRYVVERADEWKPPRDYPDHEVPKDIPAPDVAAELKSFEVADGFQVNLFAQDPMIFNPINVNWDRHGRAWVATSSTYPHIKPGRIPNDRIVILEDLDHDGVADTHQVFAEGLTVPHSVMPVEGGAYVCSTTELLFLGDADGDDVADSRRVIFSGFGNADVHHMIHGLRWSPWGDLFFTQSIYINSFVETAHGPRRLNGSGIWRFRPETERLEVFARGMVNPWGFALDDWGRGFGTDGAGGAGPHDVFPGSAFGTAVGAPRVLGGLIPGKPKNTAAEFMTGRHMPSHWQGSMLANDFRANRTVRYELEERGSGFAAREVETVLRSSHRSFRPVDIKMGPDGAIYVVDWYNPIIDHGEVDFHHPLRDKSHGRIWRLTAIDRNLVGRPRIVEATNEELFEHLKAPEQYTRTQANRELVRRGVPAAEIDAVVDNLDATDPGYDHHRLELLWLYTALNHKPTDSLWQLLAAADPRIRAAAVRVAGRTSTGTEHLALAVEDEHPRVRLEAICALRDLGSLEAANLALRALDYEVDLNLDFALEMTVRDTRDQWLPAMQAGKKVFDGNAGHLSYALKKVNDPRAIEALSEVVKRGELKGEDLANAVATVAALGEAARIGEMLELALGAPELLIALARGAEFSSIVPPQRERVASYLAANHKEAVRIAAAELMGHWKVSSGKARLVEQAASAQRMEERLAMTTALARLGATDALTELWASGKNASVRAAAMAAQASLHPETSAAPAVQILGNLTDAEDARIVFEGFLAREEGPGLLARALANAKLSEAVALAGSRSASASGREVAPLIAALNKAGGLQPVSQALSQEERRVLIADAVKMGSADRGRQVYERPSMVCTTCHLVNGKGGRLGPDLSTVGSYMTPESILESVLNPSTDIKQGYETVMVTRKDKTLVSGLLQRKTDNSILVRDPTGKIVSIPSDDIAKVDTSPVSLMPPGLTSTLRRDELVDLMKYLTSLGK